MITVSRNSQNTISVSWNLPNFTTGNLTNFEVWYAPTSSVLPDRYQNTSVIVPVDHYSVMINGIDPMLAYTIQVRAKSGAGYGPFSPALIARGMHMYKQKLHMYQIMNYQMHVL